MNRATQSRSKISCLLALALPVALAACGAQASDAANSQTAFPTFSKDRVAQEAPVEVRRMLSDDGGDLDFYALAPSPDGRYVTDIDWSTGNLTVRDLATGETRRVTNNLANGAYPEASVFSPDGRRIVYGWQSGGPSWGWDLRTIGIDGTDMKTLSVDGWPEDWSRDGRYILITMYNEDHEEESAQIATLDMETNAVRVLKTLDRRGIAGTFFSPDGRFVAFDFRSDPDAREHDIFLVSSDGSQERTLIQTPDHERLLGWLPDGSGILFHRSAADSWAIWKLPMRDGQPSGPPELLETGRVLEALEPVSDPPGLFSDFATWSPDGTRIAYFATEPGRNNERPSRIIVQSLTGEILQDLPLALHRPAHAGWTAHGLVVWDRGDQNSMDEKTPPGYYLVSLETGEATYLRKPPSGRTLPFTVSEDGSSFFPGDPAAITEYDLSTGREDVLMEQDGYALVGFPDAPDAHIFDAGQVSPDGDSILYTVVLDAPGTPRRNGGMALEIYSRSTGESRVIRGFARLIGSSWSPDGRYVVLDGQQELTGNHQLLRISVEDGSVIVLAEGPERFQRPKVSPDGRHVLVTTGEERQEIWRMTFNSGR